MVHIVHLYPKTLGLYGDAGNVLALRKRLEWRGIDVSVTLVDGEDSIPNDGDIYAIGSGSSNSVRFVGERIATLRTAIERALAREAGVLAIGAGLHLLSDRIDWSDGTRTGGAGIVSGNSIPRPTRLVGELVGSAQGHQVAGFINSGHALETDLPAHISNVVIENHATPGQTDGVEFGTLIGTSSHGSYLPMNPAIADLMLTRVLGSELPDGGEAFRRADIAAANSRDAICDRLGL
jgi:CobQ-like glutamine amidotransferase family enzyme